MLEQYRVGRASLREALRILEVHGLVSLKPGPGGGAIVADVSSESFGRMSTLYFHMLGATWGELIEARLFLEPMMARLAATYRHPHVLDALAPAIQVASDAREGEDFRWAQASHEFHAAIASISGNRVLGIIRGAIQTSYAYRLKDLKYPIEAREEAHRFHEKVAEAILKGNAAKAERLMAQHMEAVTAYAKSRYPGLMNEVIDWLR